MMISPPNEWPDTAQAGNILFFAQLARELLDPNSFETHRVFSLDTLSRLMECTNLFSDYKKSRIPRAALTKPFEEACWSVKIDPAISTVLTRIEIDTLSSELAARTSLSKANLTALYLLNRLSPIYKNTIETEILNCLTQTNKRNTQRVLISYYFSHLINIGYSRAFVSSVVNELFFKTDHQRVSLGKVRSLFKKFDGKRRTYSIYCGVNKDFGTLLNGVGIKVSARNEKLDYHSAEVKQKLPISKKNVYALVVTKQLDIYTALDKTNNIFEHVRALSFLNPNAPNTRWSNEFYIAQKRAQTGEIHELPESPLEWLSPQTTARPRILKDIRRYSDKILLGFNQNGVRRILSSVSTASSARYAPNVESQLVALWSAVEGLLSEPPEETARIQHFSDLMVPCVCNRHLHRRSVYLYDQLYASYGNKFRKIVFKEKEHKDMFAHYRLTAILMFEHNQELRDQLLKMAYKNPLALHRLYQFHQDCKSPKKLISAIENHEKRVEWQLSRIYRVRNSLVHKTEKPDYLDSVVLNMFEYYIRMLSCIVRSAARTNTPSDLDQVVSGAYLESLSTKKLIKSRLSQNEIDDDIFDAINT